MFNGQRAEVIFKPLTLKGSVQKKLMWVKNGVIQRGWASHHGAEHYFVDLGGLHLVYALFPFPVSTVQPKL
jgi:hypothetical protein